MFKKFFQNKEIAVIYIIVLSLLAIGITYATSTPGIGLTTTTALIGVDESAYGNLRFDSSNLDFSPILDTNIENNQDNVIKIEFSVGGASTNTMNDVIYDIALNELSASCELLSPYIKWKLIKNGNEISTGSLDYKFDTIVNGRLVLTPIQQDLPAYNATDKSGYDNYIFYMWFSDSCQEENISQCTGKEDQSDLLGRFLTGKIEIELYTGSKKALIRNPSTTLDSSTCAIEPNSPNLDDGNLIPVYYDDIAEVWKKADKKNKNNNWYDYDNKMWANAILISDEETRSTYQSANVDTIIPDSDITAFYVWIPRFKYRVWNITRQVGKENSYSYQADTYGIDIAFEKETKTTGNVECNYNNSVIDSDDTLSDACVYNGKDVITTTSENSNYINAWYTHPAFTFGNKDIEGFWMGKFETTGTASEPTILPDVISLREQTIFDQFTTAKTFQTYGLSNNIDAHMATNLEWGAVTYLTHSIYGLCDVTNSCQDIYINNSSEHYTGRSGGATSGSKNLILANIYPNNSTETTMYNTTGYYTYKGYFIDYSGNITATKDISKVASTTGNITGIYDMSGGAFEYVMGNIVDENNNFTTSSSETKWNGSSILDNKYYNSYSYGTFTFDQTIYNRSRLGDATAEIISPNYYSSDWETENSSTDESSETDDVINNQKTWFVRSGSAESTNGGSFYFSTYNGSSEHNLSFRSTLS